MTCPKCAEWEARYNDLLEDAVEFASAAAWQHTTLECATEGDQKTYTHEAADAVRFLAKHGRVTILRAAGRFVAFKAVEKEEDKG